MTTKTASSRGTPLAIAKRGSQMKKSEVKAVQKALKRLRREHGGILTDEMIVEAAKNPRSVLHRLVGWHLSDKEAAHQWRLYQARRLLGYIMVVPRGGDPIKAWHLVPVEGGGEQQKAYVPAEEVSENVSQRAYVLSQAKFDLQRFHRRYENYKHYLTPKLRRTLIVIGEAIEE